MEREPLTLPQLTLEEKWHKAEANLVYFVVCGIAYAKARGETPEAFGTFAGNVADWQGEPKRDPRVLVEGISRNKQQFQDFRLEILRVAEKRIDARMQGFGEALVRARRKQDVTVEEYIRFFGKKWEAIAQQLELVYTQQLQGEWLRFTVAAR